MFFGRSLAPRSRSARCRWRDGTTLRWSAWRCGSRSRRGAPINGRQNSNNFACVGVASRGTRLTNDQRTRDFNGTCRGHPPMNNQTSVSALLARPVQRQTGPQLGNRRQWSRHTIAGATSGCSTRNILHVVAARTGLPTRASSQPAGVRRLQALAEDLLAAEGPALATLVEDNFEAIDAETMASIQQATPAVAERIMSAFAVETDKRMLKAKERLEHVLDAGELLEMDRRLTTLFKQGQADAALLLCLNANVEAADPGTDKHSIMLHLYTRAQEEFEKKADPARAWCTSSARQPDAQIRDNILRTYLAPNGAHRAGRDEDTVGEADALHKFRIRSFRTPWRRPSSSRGV